MAYTPTLGKFLDCFFFLTMYELPISHIRQLLSSKCFHPICVALEILRHHPPSVPSCWNSGNPLCTGYAIANRLHRLPESFPRVSACLTIFSFKVAVSQPLQNLSLSSSLLSQSTVNYWSTCLLCLHQVQIFNKHSLTFCECLQHWPSKSRNSMCPEQQLFWTKIRHRKSNCKSTNISLGQDTVLYLKTIKIEAFLSNNVSEGEMLKSFVLINKNDRKLQEWHFIKHASFSLICGISFIKDIKPFQKKFWCLFIEILIFENGSNWELFSTHRVFACVHIFI